MSHLGFRRGENEIKINDARVAKLADAPDLGSGGEILRGFESPSWQLSILVDRWIGMSDQITSRAFASIRSIDL